MYTKQMGVLSPGLLDLEIDFENAVTLTNNTDYYPNRTGILLAQATSSNDSASLEVSSSCDGVDGIIPIRNQSIARGGSNGLRASIVVTKGTRCRASAASCTGVSVRFYPFK